MDNKAYLQIGEAMARGLAAGIAAFDRFGKVYRAAMLTVKKAYQPINKVKHYAKYSKKARIRKKYKKRLEFLILPIVTETITNKGGGESG
ncbi:MAG: hypothetical protein FWE91_09770 [Defluviitaleaceae bacterium]|nr:hypothetical protein [Defluviitaleaceae bacterium]